MRNTEGNGPAISVRRSFYARPFFGAITRIANISKTNDLFQNLIAPSCCPGFLPLGTLSNHKRCRGPGISNLPFREHPKKDIGTNYFYYLLSRENYLENQHKIFRASTTYNKRSPQQLLGY